MIHLQIAVDCMDVDYRFIQYCQSFTYQLTLPIAQEIIRDNPFGNDIFQHKIINISQFSLETQFAVSRLV